MDVRGVEGTAYRCSLPPLDFDDETENEGEVLREREEAKAAASPEKGEASDDDDEDDSTAKEEKEGVEQNRGVNLLAALEGECDTLSTGWWTYEWCHERHVKQFQSVYW